MFIRFARMDGLKAFFVLATTVLCFSSASALPVFEDNFNGNALNPAFWGTNVIGSGPAISVTGGQLVITIAANSVGTGSGADPGFFAAQVGGLQQLSGDFDIQVDYQLLTWPPGNGVRLGLGSTASPNASGFGIVSRVSLGDPSLDFPGVVPRERYAASLSNGLTDVGTSDSQGTLRMVRSGSTVTAYYLSGGSWIEISSSPGNTSDAIFGLQVWSDTNFGQFQNQAVSVAFDNFIINTGTLVPEPGTVTLLAMGLVALARFRRPQA